MGRLPTKATGIGAMIPYKGGMYEMSTLEYTEWEDKLEHLRRYEDETNAYEWITFRFLNSKGYKVDPPDAEESFPLDWDEVLELEDEKIKQEKKLRAKTKTAEDRNKTDDGFYIRFKKPKQKGGKKKLTEEERKSIYLQVKHELNIKYNKLFFKFVGLGFIGFLLFCLGYYIAGVQHYLHVDKEKQNYVQTK